MVRAKLEIPQYEREPDEPSPDPSSEAAREEIRPPKGGVIRTLQQSRKEREDISSIPTNTDKPDGGDVRGLMREAYSKSNLHTFRSDPLKRRAASGKPKGEKGKGQPDMKLRMNALLAKIKQDYA